MQTPEIPANESDRLVALDRYHILDTLPEEVYDDLTQLAADICGTPIALISLVDKDRQWFKSRVGLDATETPRDISFCGHAIAAKATLNIPDARQDPRFADNPLVASDPNIRFYAGVPLITHDNFALGTLCAIDTQTHNLTDTQIRQLEALSRLVVNQLELRLNRSSTESQLDEVLSLKQTILDNANFAIIATNLNGTIQSFNIASERMLGYAASEIVGNTTPAIFHELHEIASQSQYLSQELNTDIPVGFEVFTAKAKLGQVYEREWTYIRKDGSKFPVMLTITAIRTESGEITGYMGIAKDITTEKQAEKQVKDITSALDQTAIVAITDIQGTITFVNDKFCEISQYRREELIGQNHRLINSGYHPRSFFVEMWKTIASGQTWRDEIKNRAKDGSIYWVDTTIVPFLNEDGKPYQYLAIRKDITARKATDIELQKLSLIASKTDNVAIVTNAQGEIEWVNDSFHKLTGYTLAEVIGKKPGDILQGAKTSQEAVNSIRQALAKHEPFSGEILNYSKDGRAYWLSLNINPVFDDDGKLLQFIAIESEITTRKEIEIKLRKEVEGAMKKLNVMNERLEVSNRELLDFAYVSSHDLQEPLRKIQAFGDRLKTTCQDSLNEKGLDYLERMLNAASRAQILINDLLEFSRVTTKAQPFQPIKLSEVLEGVLSDLEVRIEKSGVILEVDPLPIVEADALQMRQILQNLIGNALKFIREGVTPVVQVRSRVYMENEQEWCEIRVIDNGIGFEQQYAERIFQIFQRLHGRKTFEGTGIGLAICRKIAERHNGTLIAQGELNQGATFIFTLPTHQPQGDLQDAD
jgi:PAS domain S-box-containing protein